MNGKYPPLLTPTPVTYDASFFKALVFVGEGSTLVWGRTVNGSRTEGSRLSYVRQARGFIVTVVIDCSLGGVGREDLVHTFFRLSLSFCNSFYTCYFRFEAISPGGATVGTARVDLAT